MEPPSTGSQTPSTALKRSSEATSSARGVVIADLPVRLVIDEPRLGAEIAQMLAPLAEHPGPYAAEIIFQASPPTMPERPADEVYGPISLWRTDGEVALDTGGGLRALATWSLAVVGGVVPSTPEGALFLRRIMHHVIAHMLSVGDRLAVHGAAIGRQGQAVLMLGASGAGKSTSGYLASLGGWSLLSDDLLVVKRATRLEVVGVHRAIAVPPDVATAGADIEHDPRDRRRPEVVLARGAHALAAVAVVAHGGAQGSVERVPGFVIATAFIGAAPDAGDLGVAAEALRTAAVLATLPCFRVRLANSAEERVISTAGLFDQLAGMAGIPG